MRMIVYSLCSVRQAAVGCHLLCTAVKGIVFLPCLLAQCPVHVRFHWTMMLPSCVTSPYFPVMSHGMPARARGTDKETKDSPTALNENVSQAGKSSSKMPIHIKHWINVRSHCLQYPVILLIHNLCRQYIYSVLTPSLERIDYVSLQWNIFAIWYPRNETYLVSLQWDMLGILVMSNPRETEPCYVGTLTTPHNQEVNYSKFRRYERI